MFHNICWSIRRVLFTFKPLNAFQNHLYKLLYKNLCILNICISIRHVTSKTNYKVIIEKMRWLSRTTFFKSCVPVNAHKHCQPDLTTQSTSCWCFHTWLIWCLKMCIFLVFVSLFLLFTIMIIQKTHSDSTFCACNLNLMA